MEYKGFKAKISFNEEDMVLHGKVANTSDLITFEAKSVDKLQREFELAVDDYLDFCEEVKKTPRRENVSTYFDMYHSMDIDDFARFLYLTTVHQLEFCNFCKYEKECTTRPELGSKEEVRCINAAKEFLRSRVARL